VSLSCGIVGLPNVGKSLLFRCLTKIAVPSENYPFCTIGPSTGRLFVPDKRLNILETIIKPQKVIQTTMDFTDIAGLVKNASKGEGLGNQFLGHIRQVESIVHVLRCFESDEIIHVHGRINPLDDMQVVNMELALADLEVVQKKFFSLEKSKKGASKKDLENIEEHKKLLEKVKDILEEGTVLRKIQFEEEEKIFLDSLNLITFKKTLYLCNIQDTNPFYDAIYKEAVAEGSDVLNVNIAFEAEILDLTDEEKIMFTEGKSSLIEVLIEKSYALLDLQTFFTAGVQEVRSWSFHKGFKAPQAAGVIHSDFEKGFICAEIYHVNDLIEYKSVSKLKELGKIRLEGKEYLIKDGDICHFRFNV